MRRELGLGAGSAVAQVEGLTSGWASLLSKGDPVGKEGQENQGQAGKGNKRGT